MRRIIPFLLIISLFLCSCSGDKTPAVVKEDGGRKPIRTFVMPKSVVNDEAVNTPVSDGTASADVLQEPSPTPEPITEPVSESSGIVSFTPMPATVEAPSFDTVSYTEFYRYMLSKRTGDANPIFSPESLKIAFDIYAQLLDDDYKPLFDAFLDNKDYLSFVSYDGFNIINRLWVNNDISFNLNDGPLIDNDLVYKMDMRDGEKATKEKNDYVAEQTNGFITSTPTEFNYATLFDTMNIVYFKSDWKDGDKKLDDEPTSFHNDNGEVIDTVMFRDYGGHYDKTDEATAFSMSYSNGMTFTAVLPNEGYSLDMIDLDPFIKNEAERVSAEVTAKFPSFETQSQYDANFSEFNLPEDPYERKDILDRDLLTSGNPDLEIESPVITQVAKIKFDHTGTEAAAVTEVARTVEAVMLSQDYYDFICDRPFAYFITDTYNGDVAFIGAVLNLGEN